ncbi:HNH endonuclease [Entomobacter blattae]|uniref:HNH endonuclease n=1 Tax=Entomobacter blattae TaxID=2762277 RepID=UPI001EF09CE0|nr:HNH endonuclease [Entomobacter blattae]
MFCQKEGRIKEATEVDHIQTVRNRPDLRLDPRNLRALCKSCHSARTMRDQVHGHSLPHRKAI